MKRRFYRGKLATIVWNPSAGKPLCKFVKGQFVTEDNKIADILLAKGYHEVPLSAERPPLLPEEPVQEAGKDVTVMGRGMSEGVALANLVDATDDNTVEPAKVKPKAKKDGGSKKGTKRKTIKRRTK